MLFKLKSAKDNAWILKKIKDSDAEPNKDITEEMPNSILTGRNLDEIASE